MRYFLVDTKPTAAQLQAINAQMLEGRFLGHEGKYIVVFDGDKFDAPRWAGRQELNLPGEPHRCLNCGEVI